MSNIKPTKQELELAEKVEAIKSWVTKEIDTDEKVDKINQELFTISESAEKLNITSAIENGQTGDIIKNLKERIKTINEVSERFTKPLHELHRSTTGHKNKYVDKIQAIIKTLSEKQNKWAVKVLEERKAEEERLKKKAEAETERKRKEKLKQAEAWEEKGDSEKAEERRVEAESLTASYVIPEELETTFKAESSKSTIKETLTVQVVNVRELCKAIAEGKMPVNCINPKHISTAKLKSFCEGMGIESDCHGLKIKKEITTDVR